MPPASCQMAEAYRRKRIARSNGLKQRHRAMAAFKLVSILRRCRVALRHDECRGQAFRLPAKRSMRSSCRDWMRSPFQSQRICEPFQMESPH